MNRTTLPAVPCISPKEALAPYSLGDLALRLSGFMLPSPLVSSGSILALWFTTDFAVSAQGFKAVRLHGVMRPSTGKLITPKSAKGEMEGLVLAGLKWSGEVGQAGDVVGGRGK
ncbi:unnamed protein product [Boreogadus saida]